MKTKRNYNLDFLRGLATIWIVVIHTAWWSGTLYLPSWFSNLILIIDVPVFMFIAGASFNYVNSVTRNLRGILVQWKKWLYFLIFYTLILIIFFKDQFILKDIFSWIVYIFPHSNNLEVVGGSIWFMIMYIKVTIICSIIICTVNHFSKNNNLNSLHTICGIMLLIFLFCASNNNFLFFDSTISYYSLIYLLGYILHNYRIKDFKQFLLLEGIDFILILFIFKVLNLNITKIQDLKFPPSIAYLLISLISIILFWYLKDKLKIKENNKINYLGKNAIVFYFAQGISSSFLYFVYRIIPFTNSILIFLLLLFINLTCTTIGAVFLNESYQFLAKHLTCKKTKKALFPITNSKKVV